MRATRHLYGLLAAQTTVTPLVSVSNITEWVKLITAGVGLLTAFISLVIIFVGRKIIKDIQLRGYDLLIVKLRSLKRSARIEHMQTLKSEMSALWHISPGQMTVGFENLAPRYERDVFHKKFIPKVKDTLELLEKKDGQIPLSESMYNDWMALCKLLSDILEAAETPPFDYDLIPDVLDKRSRPPRKEGEKQIEFFHEVFDKLIDEIIKEVNAKTPKLYNKLWEVLK